MSGVKGEDVKLYLYFSLPQTAHSAVLNQPQEAAVEAYVMV